jgi:D-serine deaminase-like pyridoxal phosphate-dependent protein
MGKKSTPLPACAEASAQAGAKALVCPKEAENRRMLNHAKDVIYGQEYRMSK